MNMLVSARMIKNRIKNINSTSKSEYSSIPNKDPHIRRRTPSMTLSIDTIIKYVLKWAIDQL